MAAALSAVDGVSRPPAALAGESEKGGRIMATLRGHGDHGVIQQLCPCIRLAFWEAALSLVLRLPALIQGRRSARAN